ncbi:MAG: hydantoinase/oxoprolinase family protein, partial [Alphaproteobacteria bacterium]|nr:hydantoinase/oxoprolinase family protein [Alphaproteobacteria bacterium]
MADLSTRYRIAVDVGGTFTDLMVLDAETGEVHALKTPTTPADPSEGLLTGIAEAKGRLGFEPGDVGFILHGTTIATNAVLERKLPEGALIANRGFTDVLEIGRHVRREPYTLKPTPQTVLVPRDRRYGIEGRMRWDGSEEAPLDEKAVAAIAREISEAGIGAVAVAFLHAYRDPAHERRVEEILIGAAPGIPVSLSSDVSPEIREFERASTTVLNALLVPVVNDYLARLEARLLEARLSARLYLVQSNGGVATPSHAARLPVRLLLSGPSGGAMAAADLSGTLARPDLVAVDMGGTSFDVSVVRGGESTVVTEGEIDGLPVRLPMVEMRTIGAGGGSIASVAPGGALIVGPASAGADPGPAAYGRGGAEPTVTDANIVLGRLDPD